MWCVASKSVLNGLFALFCGSHGLREHTPCFILIKYVKGKMTARCLFFRLQAVISSVTGPEGNSDFCFPRRGQGKH